MEQQNVFSVKVTKNDKILYLCKEIINDTNSDLKNLKENIRIVKDIQKKTNKFLTELVEKTEGHGTSEVI